MLKEPRYNTSVLTRFILGGFLLVSLAACGPSAQNARARTGLQSYLVALRGTDPRPVYQMLTAEQRRATSYQQWAKRWNASKAERQLQAKQIEKSLLVQQGVDEDAQLRFDDGRTISLARAPDGWRLNQALLGRNRADKPDDALNLFSHAVRERNVDDLLQMLSKRHQTRIETELAAFSEGLAQELAKGGQSPYLLSDTKAELAWNYDGIRYKVVLVREEGEWLIDDVHMGPDPTLDPEEAKTEDVKRTLEGPRRR